VVKYEIHIKLIGKLTLGNPGLAGNSLDFDNLRTLLRMIFGGLRIGGDEVIENDAQGNNVKSVSLKIMDTTLRSLSATRDSPQLAVKAVPSIIFPRLEDLPGLVQLLTSDELAFRQEWLTHVLVGLKVSRHGQGRVDENEYRIVEIGEATKDSAAVGK
jgi:hypothetical protein